MNDNFQGQLPVKIQRPRWSPVWWVVSGWLKGVGGCQKEKMRVDLLSSVWNSLEDSSMFLKAKFARVVQTLNSTSSFTTWHHILKMNLSTLSVLVFFQQLGKKTHRYIILTWSDVSISRIEFCIISMSFPCSWMKSSSILSSIKPSNCGNSCDPAINSSSEIAK